MKKIALLSFLCWIVCSIWAVPARREPFQRVQPNGDTLTVRLIGDEHWHAMYTEDGYLVCEDEQGYLCYAKWAPIPEEATDYRRKAVPTRKRAKDADKRTCCEKRWLVRKKIATL
ncbi:MAG: hypothetical protein MJZ89_00425 [Paludibacteraceae bacterium]|nr:hypothetical protein [Paludibacteraceae bacterium]